MKPAPTIGQTLYSLNIGNAARGREQKLTPVTVTKVGRKYFTVEEVEKGWKLPTSYSLDTWREKTDYSPNIRLYASPQEWEDEKEGETIAQQVRETFYYGCTNLSIDSLRQIKAILDSAKPI